MNTQFDHQVIGDEIYLQTNEQVWTHLRPIRSLVNLITEPQVSHAIWELIWWKVFDPVNRQVGSVEINHLKATMNIVTKPNQAEPI